MARVGSFAGPNFYVGAPLSVVHPPDNQFPQFDQEILAQEGLTPEEMREIQQEVDEITATLILSRDYRE